jgi:hypothetical protein
MEIDDRQAASVARIDPGELSVEARRFWAEYSQDRRTLDALCARVKAGDTEGLSAEAVEVLRTFMASDTDS